MFTLQFDSSRNSVPSSYSNLAQSPFNSSRVCNVAKRQTIRWLRRHDKSRLSNFFFIVASQTSSPDNPFAKSNSVDDFDFVDVEGDVEGEASGRNAHSKTKDVLEEDLQFSSDDSKRDDDFDEVPFGANDNNELDALELGEIREPGEVPADDDSQQAAEAMVQLGNVGFYVGEQQLLQQDESMDVDPNYDPSDFLLAGLPTREEKDMNKIQDDLAVSESDEETDNIGSAEQATQESQQQAQPDEDCGGDLWF